MKRQTLSGNGSAAVALVTLAMFCPMTWGQYTWTQQTALGSTTWYGAAISADGTTMLVCSSDGPIYTSSDSGDSWISRSAAAGSRWWSSAGCSDDGTKMVATVYGGYLYQSTDSGVTWTERQASLEQWVGVDCSADGTKWAAMPRQDYVYMSSDSGDSWSAQTGSGSRGWRHVAMSADGTKLLGTVYTGSTDNYVYTSTDSGVTWTERTQPGQQDWQGCVSSADGTILAIGATYTPSSYIWTSSDSGATWTERTSSGDRDWNDMACTPDGSTMIAAAGNALLISTDSGATWSVMADAGVHNFMGVDMSEDGEVVVAVVYSGYVYVGVRDAAVDFTAASQSDAEDTGTMTVTAQLSKTVASDVTVPFTVSGTAGNPADYAITASPVTITAGQLTTDITITVVDDALDEANETVIVTMGTPTNASQGTVVEHTATITDNDDGPTVQFTAASQSEAEDVGTMTITAQLSEVSGQTVSVPFTVSGTAGNPADYTITASPVTITAGQTTTDITITVVNDTLDEANETVIVTMGTPTNATKGATDEHTATITDNDATPSVQFTSASQSEAEDVGTMTITAQLSAVSGQAVSVPFTVSGTATGTDDYTITASPVTITAGQTTTDITITVVDDDSDEPNETVIVTMGTPTNATKGATDEHTATITDDDDEPTVEFTSASQSGAEGGGVMVITVESSATAGRVLTVPFTVGGTASDPADYSITASPVTIAVGQSTAEIAITVVDDADEEDSETVIVTIGTPTNATVGTVDEHTVTITDNESVVTAPTVTTATVSAISTTTATCGGEVTSDGGADVTARGVCWSTSANPTVGDDKTTDGTGTGEFTSSLTGLSADTTYYVAAYATNSEGTSYGDDVTFTTSEEGAEAAPSLSLTIACAQETAIVGDRLTFEIGLENSGDGAATDVIVEVPLPDSVEFVSAAFATDAQAQQTDVVATEVDGVVVLELGDMAAGETLTVELLVDTLEAGELSLSASVTSEEITTPVEADQAAAVTVETVADVISPACAAGMCAPLNLSPLLIIAGLLGMKCRYRRRGGVS